MMAYYGDYEKDNLKDNIDDFLEDHEISVLMDIVTDSIYAKECDIFNKYKKQIEEEYGQYKKQVEEMKKIIK